MLKNLLRVGRTEPLSFSIYIGFFAGLFTSILRTAASYFKFTTFDNSFLLADWFVNLGVSTLLEQLLGGIAFIAFSILASFLYLFLFRNKQGPIWGFCYGLAFWLILFILCPLLLKWPVASIELVLETQLFELCMMLVWGVFIGYSIAFEFTDDASHERFYSKT